MALGGGSMAHQIRAWRNETRAWRRAMLKTPRPNTDFIPMNVLLMNRSMVFVSSNGNTFRV